MKAADIEWTMLRGALIGLAIAVVLSVAMIAGSYQFWESANRDLKRAERTLQASRAKYRTVDEQEAMIRDFYPVFQRLQEQGIIGNERRLDWIETLRRADENLKLPGLTYSISTQEPFEAEYGLAGGVYQPFSSDMNLTLGMLHGEDLFSLLENLDVNAEGLYSVDTCNMIRRTDEIGSPQQAHLSSTCRLRWFTIRKPGEPGASS